MTEFIESDPEWAGLFGRSIVEHDEANRRFPAKGVLFQTAAPIVTKMWRRPGAYDQGNVPQCVAFATKGLCWTWPILQRIPLDKRKTIDPDALYRLAQTLDPWPGEAYEGTSTLAGLKAAHQTGLIPGYRWCFGKDDVLRTLSQYGPVTIGVAWTRNMMNPGPGGLLDIGGDVVGGHCVELHGVDPRKGTVTGTNSWGPHWGNMGRFTLKWTDLDALLKNQGESATIADTAQE